MPPEAMWPFRGWPRKRARDTAGRALPRQTPGPHHVLRRRIRRLLPDRRRADTEHPL